MNTNFVPAICKGKKPSYRGCIELRVTTVIEKYRYLDKCGFSLNEKNELNTNAFNFAAMANMIEISKDHYIKVELEHIESQKKYTSFEDLICDSSLESTLIEIANLVVYGFNLEKK